MNEDAIGISQNSIDLLIKLHQAIPLTAKLINDKMIMTFSENEWNNLVEISEEVIQYLSEKYGST